MMESFYLNEFKNTLLNPYQNPARENFSFYIEGTYIPEEGVVVKHGHEYEAANQFDNEEAIVESSEGKKYFIAPWGSYYVTQVINKFKEERAYINQIRPIRTFIIYGLTFDTLFMLRFLFANIYYFIMVRFLDVYQNNRSFRDVKNNIIRELKLFQSSENFVESFFKKNKAKVLIFGHTHHAIFRTYKDGSMLINTGTWTKLINLDFFTDRKGINLTYCQIDISDKKTQRKDSYSHLNVSLNSWEGARNLPYTIFE